MIDSRNNPSKRKPFRKSSHKPTSPLLNNPRPTRQPNQTKLMNKGLISFSKLLT